MRALLSAYDRTGLVDFARVLVEAGFELLSTGGTANKLKNSGLDITEVANVTGAPEILDGRVIAGEVVVAVDDAAEAVGLLAREEIGHRVVDLNLDEIFEAFVVGQRDIQFELPEFEATAHPV